MLKLFENFRQKIYCDLDAVLCDFIKQFNVTLISNNEEVIDFDEYRKKVGYQALWNMVEQDGVEFWSELEWMPGGKKLWEFLIQFNNLEILRISKLITECSATDECPSPKIISHVDSLAFFTSFSASFLS